MAGGKTKFSFGFDEVSALNNQDVGALILFGCNAGHSDHSSSNVASWFAEKVNGAKVLASDGTVEPKFSIFSGIKYKSKIDDAFNAPLIVSFNRSNLGWLIYQYNGFISVSGSQGKLLTLTQMLNKLN